MSRLNYKSKDRARLASNKLTRTMLKSPEGKMQQAMLDRAILDLVSTNDTDRATAQMFINSGMPMVQMAGAEPEYVRRVLKEWVLL